MAVLDRCEMCGARPATEVRGMLRCLAHADYVVYTCRRCGARCIRHEAVSDPVCTACAADEKVARIPADLLAKLDALLVDHLTIDAIKLLRSELDSRPGINEAQDLIASRRRTLDLPPRRPSPPPDVELLFADLSALLPRPVAIEALWDGDTIGWFVILDAILPIPSAQHPRFTARRISTLVEAGGDLRLMNGQVPPWPEARLADWVGRELARRLGIPFYFGSPERPDDVPRWWDVSGQ